MYFSTFSTVVPKRGQVFSRDGRYQSVQGVLTMVVVGTKGASFGL